MLLSSGRAGRYTTEDGARDGVWEVQCYLVEVEVVDDSLSPLWLRRICGMR